MAGWRIFVGASMMALALVAAASGASRRVLYLTATYGFRHEASIDASIQVMQDLAKASGIFEVVNTEDVSLINADNLRNYDAVYFFTSGELPLSDRQKADLLDFVRQGKGFGGSHSATDTLYTWPEYGAMIGGIFDGHPWTQEAAEDVEDPESAIVKHMSPGFRALEEFYQFRNFSRDNVRVLLTLNTSSVDLNADGVNRTDGDFASVWIRKYGLGRVFYSAFGHFEDSFRLPMFRTMLMQALLWLTGEIEVDATPRSGPSAPPPSLGSAGVTTPGGRNDAFAPGSIVQIAGDRLTSGSSLAAAIAPLPVRLAGTHVEVNDEPAVLFSVTPGMVLAQLPVDLPAGADASLVVSSVNRASAPVTLHMDSAAPGIVAADRAGSVLIIYATGLGSTVPAVAAGTPSPARTLAFTRVQPTVRIANQTAVVQFSGLAPELVGVYQVNAEIPADVPRDADGTVPVILESGGRQSDVYRLAF
ncbi:MAG TPA: ThuA domain-containing protein [Bryobacteraceae bacterium]